MNNFCNFGVYYNNTCICYPFYSGLTCNYLIDYSLVVKSVILTYLSCLIIFHIYYNLRIFFIEKTTISVTRFIIIFLYLLLQIIPLSFSFNDNNLTQTKNNILYIDLCLLILLQEISIINILLSITSCIMLILMNVLFNTNNVVFSNLNNNYMIASILLIISTLFQIRHLSHLSFKLIISLLSLVLLIIVIIFSSLDSNPSISMEITYFVFSQLILLFECFSKQHKFIFGLNDLL